MKNRNYIIEELSDYDSIFSNLILYHKMNSIVFLRGELGSGKTTFIQRYMQYHYNIKNVTSPTFGIVNNYSNSEHNILRCEKPVRLDQSVPILVKHTIAHQTFSSLATSRQKSLGHRFRVAAECGTEFFVGTLVLRWKTCGQSCFVLSIHAMNDGARADARAYLQNEGIFETFISVSIC